MSFKKPYLVAIGGGSGSGKTTFANEVRNSFPTNTVLIVQQDHFYKDLSHLKVDEREKQNFDHPDAIDHDLLFSQAQKLSEGSPIERPTYDFRTHTKTGKTVSLDPSPVIIFDGIFSLYDQRMLGLVDLKVFVDVPDDVRVLRRMQRDVVERGRTAASVSRQYLATVRPMHDMYVAPTKWLADLVVPWMERRPNSITCVSSVIEKYMEKLQS